MSELDNRIREGLERLAHPADGSGAIDDVARRKRRYRTARRARAGALAVAVVLGSAAGVWGLSRTFMPAPDRPVIGPGPSPTTSASPSPSADPVSCPSDGEPLPESYRPSDTEEEIDGLGDGRLARPRIYADEARPLRCRYLLVADGPDRSVLYVAVPPVEWMPGTPAILMSAEIDGEPGHELVVDFGGPTHPHRTGLVFTLHEQELVMMRVRSRDPGGLHSSPYVPLGGEFAVGIDCSNEPGTIVATSGSFADEGNDDRHYDITREFYRADGAVFEAFDSETFTVEVGEERELWPETADDPFRNCPR